MLLVIFFFGCNSKPSEKTITSKVIADPPIETKIFPAENHLFLDFYAGINRDEVKETLKKHIGESDAFKLEKSYNNPWRVDREHLMKLSESNNDSIHFFPGFKNLYYEFSNGREVYYALLDFEFATYSSLGKISLLLPDYTTRSGNNAQRVKQQFDKAKVLSSSIYKLYRQKYGNPIIEPGYKSKAAEIYYDVMTSQDKCNRTVRI